MNITRLLISIAIVGITLYAYVNKHNALMRMRIRLPELASEMKTVEEENVRLQFLIEKFENPLHLMELARKPQYAHLKHPVVIDIVIISSEDKK